MTLEEWGIESQKIAEKIKNRQIEETAEAYDTVHAFTRKKTNEMTMEEMKALARMILAIYDELDR